MTNWDCSQESQVKRKGKRASMEEGRRLMADGRSKKEDFP